MRLPSCAPIQAERDATSVNRLDDPRGRLAACWSFLQVRVFMVAVIVIGGPRDAAHERVLENVSTTE
jgi:hypothetical protein